MHLGIVHAVEVFDLWIVHPWSLKNKEMFQIGRGGPPGMEPENKELFKIGLVDRPRVTGVQLLDWTCVEPLKRGGVPNPLLLFCV